MLEIYNTPAPASFITEEAIWESFKKACASRKQKPGVVHTNLMHSYVHNIAEVGEKC